MTNPENKDSKWLSLFIQNLGAFITFFMASSGLWLHFKYKQYGINIFQYISSLDLILFEPTVIVFLITLLLIPFLMLIESINTESNKIKMLFNKKIVRTNIFLIQMFLLNITSNNQNKYIVVCVFLFLSILFNVLVYRKVIVEKDYTHNNSILILNIILIFVLIINSFYSLNKDNFDGENIRFYYKNQLIKTSDSFIHIGSTTQAIFLRNTSEKATYIYEKSLIDNLVIIK